MSRHKVYRQADNILCCYCFHLSSGKTLPITFSVRVGFEWLVKKIIDVFVWKQKQTLKNWITILCSKISKFLEKEKAISCWSRPVSSFWRSRQFLSGKRSVWKFHKKKIVIFYTEILTGKVVLWRFFPSKTSEKIHNSTFQVKISV